MGKRSVSVDIAKGVAIIAIVCGHISFPYPSGHLLYTKDLFASLWHVAVFFLLAGFFIKEDQLVQPKLWFRKKFSSLYLKILYFYIPAVLLHNVLIDIGWYSLESTSPVIHTYLAIDFVKQTILAVCCAGREPILGAMWFVYALFIALIGLSVLSWACKKIAKDIRQYEWTRVILLLVLCAIAGIMSNKYGVSIKRFSNIPTAMLLIYVGMQMYQRVKLQFTNGYVAMVCAILVFEIACMLGGVGLGGNLYKDICQVIVAAPAMLYVIMYIGKHIERNRIGKALAYVGKNSFYVMALHFVGFKCCTLMLNALVSDSWDISELQAPAGDNILLLILYGLFGVIVPLVFMWIFREVRSAVNTIMCGH